MLAALGDLHTLVVTPVQARNQLVGALVVMFAEIARPITPSTTALLDLLAGHGGAAIANALAFETAVRRQAHEKAVIDAVADGVATLDGYGLVSGWNRAAAELTGRSANEAFGRPLPFPVGTEQEPVEHRFGDRWVEIIATPLDEGQVVVLRDVSRQKALEVAKTMFVAATSHELKTPLTVIRSFADWLRDNGETADPLAARRPTPPSPTAPRSCTRSSRRSSSPPGPRQARSTWPPRRSTPAAWPGARRRRSRSPAAATRSTWSCRPDAAPRVGRPPGRADRSGPAARERHQVLARRWDW